MSRATRKKQQEHSVLRWIAFISVAAILAGAAFVLLNKSHKLPLVRSVQSDSTFTIGLTHAPTSLDIRYNEQDSVEQALLENVYETVINRNNSNALAAGLATHWDQSSDGLTYTFTFPDNMRFSDGTVLDASAVVWSLQQTLEHHYVGYEKLGNIASIENPNATTVVITLREPNPQLLRALSERPGIVYNKNANINYEHEAAGSGPFTLASYNGNSLELERNKQYWSTPAKASHISLKYYDDDHQIITDLENNAIVMGIPHRVQTAQEAQQNPSLSVVTGMSTRKVLLALNNANDSPFSDQQVRRALRFALNAADITKSQPNAAAQLSGPISQMQPGYANLDGLFPYQPDTARNMLAYFDPSYHLNTFSLLTTETFRSVGERICDQINNAGFQATLDVVDEQTLASRVQSGDYQAALMTMDDPDDYAVFADGNSFIHYENSDAQRAYDEAMHATNEHAFNQKLQHFSRLVSEDAACAWLYMQSDVIVSKTRIEGYPTNMISRRLPLRELTR